MAIYHGCEYSASSMQYSSSYISILLSTNAFPVTSGCGHNCILIHNCEIHNFLQAKITLCQERKAPAHKDPKEKFISTVMKKSNKY